MNPLRWLFRRKSQEHDLDAELRSHLEIETEERRLDGLSPAEADFAARRAFGNLAIAKENVRQAWAGAAFDNLARDVRYAARGLARDRAFALVAILTLVLGIGGTTAIFSVVNGVLLRPLPYPEADRLFSVQEKASPFTSYPEFDDWRAQNHVFSGMASSHEGSFTLAGETGAKLLAGAVVSANFLSVLRCAPLLGAGFDPRDDDPGTRAVLLSEHLWRTGFHADPAIVGRTIPLDGGESMVRGVMPAAFQFPPASNADLWTTSAVDTGAPKVARGYNWLEVIGRLKPGVTPAQAAADMNFIARRLAQQYPNSNSRRTSSPIVPEQERIVGGSRLALLLVLAVATGVLLIACVNLASMSLARDLSRQREIVLRAALGARRASVMAQLLTESVLVSAIGGALGAGLAAWGTRTLLAVVPDAIPRAAEVSMDGRVLAFAAALSIATGIVFGLVPAWQMSFPNLETVLREGRDAAAGGVAHRRIRAFLVLAETALAVVLMSGAGLLTASYLHLTRANPGFDTSHLLTFQLSLPVKRYNPERALQFYDDLLARLTVLPRVRSAAAAWPVPLGSTPISAFELEGQSYPAGSVPSARIHIVSPGYFRTLGIEVRSGRDFGAHDDMSSTPIVIVDEAFARQFFPHESALGKRIKPNISMTVPIPWREIVGVVNSTKSSGMADTFQPQYYMPYSQLPGPFPPIAMKVDGNPGALIQAVGRTVAAIDKSVAAYGIQSMDEIISAGTVRERLNTVLFAWFGVLAVLLAGVGIYGVTNYSVGRMTREMGIRLALGARSGQVFRQAVVGTMRSVLMGLVLGVTLTRMLARFVASLLYDTRPTDPLLIAGAAAVLLIAASIATCLPARRAIRVDPAAALRFE